MGGLVNAEICDEPFPISELNEPDLALESGNCRTESNFWGNSWKRAQTRELFLFIDRSTNSVRRLFINCANGIRRSSILLY